MAISAHRTVVIGKPGAGGKPLRWNPTEAGSDLEWSIDAAVPLAEASDAIVEMQWSLRPSGTGERVLSSVSVSGSVITGRLSGGVRGRNYTNKLIVTGHDGNAWEWLIGQFVEPGPGAYPLPKAPNLGFGTPIMWTFTYSLDFSKPLNSGYIALLAGF